MVRSLSVVIAPCILSLVFTFGRLCVRKFGGLLIDVACVSQLRGKRPMLVCICRFLFLLNLGWILAWTLCWASPALNEVVIQFLWSQIISPKWHILLPASVLHMKSMWHCYIFERFICLHGLPSFIIFYRDTRFLSHFWQSSWKFVNTTLNFSSAYHTQTDWQTELFNCSLGDLLCSLVGDIVKSSDLKLCQAEFTHNYALPQYKFQPFLYDLQFCSSWPS